MADNSVGGLYMRLGLSLSELETDFIAAEKTTRENLARLNRESNLIKLRAEVEIGNLDETADATQILAIRENALNEQLAIQRDRIRLAEATYNDLNQRHGESATVTQRAATALERERLSLQRLERELRDVHDAQNDFNNGQNDSSESSGGLGNLSETLQSMPMEKFAAIGAGIAAIGTAANTAMSSVQEMTEKFRELETQAYELNMSVNDTENFLRHMRLAGGDIGDFEGYIRGITDAYVKGEFDDPEFIALEKYGAKIVDDTGKLKNFQEITEEVYQAWKKADAAGEGIEFLQLTGGESGVRDAIQYFKRYEEAKEDAEKIFDAGLDPEELHEAERALNLLTEQTDEFKDAMTNIITPFAIDSAKTLFEVFHSGTEFLVENKEEFQRWGFIVEESISTVLMPIEKLKEKWEEVRGFDFGNERLNKAFQGALDNATKNPLENFYNFLGDNVFDGIIERAEKKQQEYNSAIQETAESQKKLNEEIEKSEQGNPLNQYDTKRITAFRDELEDLRLEMQYADNEFALAKAQADLWLEREMARKNYLSSDEEIVLRELHAQKILAIEERQADEIAKIKESTADIEYGLTHSAFEKQLYDIERWKDAQLEKAETAEETAAIIANAAAKEADAFQREMDRIQGRIESAQDKLFRLTHSQEEYDLYQAQKEYQQYIKDGVPEALARQVYDATVADIQNRARNDKGGSYTKSRGGSSAGRYLYDFTAPNPTDWATVNARDLAFDTLRQNNQQLADSCRNLIAAQNSLVQSTNQAAQGFEYIEGDRIVTSFNNSMQGVIQAQEELQDATVQVNEKYWENLTNLTQRVAQGMSEGDIMKIEGGYTASDYTADMYNFNHRLLELGLSDNQVTAYLDRINTQVESLRNTEVSPVSAGQNQPANVTVAPNINIDLGGAYVFDDSAKRELTDDIANEVVASVKDAFQQASNTSNYSYSN